MRLLIAGLVAGLALAACDTLPTLPTFGLGSEDSPPVQSMALADGRVVVGTPEGYCIDERTSRPRRGFVIMAGCALISGDPRMPQTDGLITVQLGDEGTASVGANPSALRNLLATADGAALLSPSGDPTAIEVDDLEVGGNVVYVHFRDGGPPPVSGLEQLEWRAFLDLGDRLATVTVRGFERAPISSADGLRLLRATVDTIRYATNTQGVATDT